MAIIGVKWLVGMGILILRTIEVFLGIKNQGCLSNALKHQKGLSKYVRETTDRGCVGKNACDGTVDIGLGGHHVMDLQHSLAAEWD